MKTLNNNAISDRELFHYSLRLCLKTSRQRRHQVKGRRDSRGALYGLLVVGTTYEMTFSMLEIYNEDARDLLVGNGKKSALKIRQHPKKGFYGTHL